MNYSPCFIFIFSGYIHQVRGYSRTVAVTTLFTAGLFDDNFNLNGCLEDKTHKDFSMNDIRFQWAYQEGDKTIDMGYMNVNLLKIFFRKALRNKRFTKNGSVINEQGSVI